MKGIGKNLLYNSIYQILVIITPLITSPYISRVLGAEGIGTYSYNYTIANYFLVFAMLGVSKYGNRSIAKIQNNKMECSRTFWSIYAFQLLTTLVLSILYSLYIIFLSGSNSFIAIIEFFVVLSAGFDITWLFFGLELFKVTTIRSIIIKLLTVICILIFVRSANDLWIYCLIMSLGIFLNQALLWVVLRNYVIWVKPTFIEIISNYKPNFILFLPVIAISLYSYLDRIMLGSMSTFRELGYFDNAEKITSIPMSLITAMGTVMLPRISHLVENKNKIVEDKLNRLSMNFVIILSAAFSFGIIGISKGFVPLFFGPGFHPVILLLALMAPKMIFVSWGNIICNQYLLPHSKDIIYTVSVFAGAVINVVINIILIPKFGAAGTAFSSLITEFIIALVQTKFAWHHMQIGLFVKECAPYVLFGMVMYISIIHIAMGSMFITIIVQVVVGALIYSALTLLYMLFFKKNMLRNFIMMLK